MKDARGRRLAEARRELGHFLGEFIHFNNLQLPRIISPKYTRFYPSHLDNYQEFGHAVHGHAHLLAVTGSKLKLYTQDLEYVQEFDERLFVNCGNTASISDTVLAILCFNSNADNFLSTWNIETKQVLSQLRLSRRGTFLSSIVSLNNGTTNTIVVGDDEGSLHIVQHNGNGTKLRRRAILHHEFEKNSVIVAHDNTFAVTSDDNTINVWDAVDQTRVAMIPMEEETDVDINDRYLVCIAGKTLRVYEKQLLPNNNSDNNSGNRELYASRKGSYTYELSSCYTDSNELPNVFRGELKLLPNNLLIVGAHGDGVLLLLDLELKKVVARYKLPFEEVPWLDISSDARLLVSVKSSGESKHAVIRINRPKKVLRALQLYAKYRYGTTANKTAKHRKHRRFTVTKKIIATIAKATAVCGVVWTSVKLISRIAPFFIPADETTKRDEAER